MIDVNLRTVQRRQINHTLIKPEKIKSIVLETLMPYQLLNNLNAEVAVTTYYDFKTRKYYLEKRNKSLTRALRLKNKIEIRTVNLRTIDLDTDLNHINQFLSSQMRKASYYNKNSCRIITRTKFYFQFKVRVLHYFASNGDVYEKLKTKR
jgi:hypothetical protein